MSRTETCFSVKVPTNSIHLEYGNAVTEVMKYCEARLLNVRGEKRNLGGSGGQDPYKDLCMSICIIWDDMEGLFAERGLFGSMVTKKIRSEWAKRVIAREMSILFESLQVRVLDVLSDGDRVDVEATLGWISELRGLDTVFSTPSVPHPMCDWIDAQLKKIELLKAEMRNMAHSSRRMPRGREKITPMDFVFAVAVHNSAVNLAV